MVSRWSTAIALAFLPALAVAQPSLDSLWPNADGLQWNYQFTDLTRPADATLSLSGTVLTAGGQAQVLLANHGVPAKLGTASRSDPTLRAIYRMRPDLRPAIERKFGKPSENASVWWPLLLHQGYFMKSASSMQMWQPDWGHATWTYLRDDLRVGATFTHQLVPELANNVFLYGTVEAIDATVSTLAGTFEHAVRMHYLIDYGWSDAIGDDGTVVGRFRGETRGHVHFVPGVGPVELLQDDIPVLELDCSPGPCGPELTGQLGVIADSMTLSLTSSTVAVQPTSWSQVKALYQ